MKRGLITATTVIKILVLYQIVVKRNAWFIKPTLSASWLDINKSVTLSNMKQNLNIVWGIIESRSKALNIKWYRTIKRKLKSALEHQKLYGRFICLDIRIIFLFVSVIILFVYDSDQYGTAATFGNDSLWQLFTDSSRCFLEYRDLCRMF